MGLMPVQYYLVQYRSASKRRFKAIYRINAAGAMSRIPLVGFNSAALRENFPEFVNSRYANLAALKAGKENFSAEAITLAAAKGWLSFHGMHWILNGLPRSN